MTLIVVHDRNTTERMRIARRYIDATFPRDWYYADLGGYSPDAAAPPLDVLSRFLRELGIPEPDTPRTLSEAAALWLAQTTGLRLRLFLDDALSAAQVGCLLPGPGPSMVIVTTRWRLGLAVDDARFAYTRAQPGTR